MISEDDDVIAVGANDVPTFGGGQYWPGKGDQRDHQRGHDSNATQREEIVRDVASRICQSGVIRVDDEETRVTLDRAIRQSRLLDITEFGREVHAEMEALLSCARPGARARRGTLYTTTFPCHNCAKHIVGAGVARVVFVEPYPKSKAFELHEDSLTFARSELDHKVLLEPFVGIGPTRYMDLFSLQLGRGSPLSRKTGSIVAAWEKQGARPRVQMRPIPSLIKATTPDNNIPVLALPRTVMPTIGNKLAGKNNINPAIDRAKVRSTLCFFGRDNKKAQRGQWAFSPVFS